MASGVRSVCTTCRLTEGEKRPCFKTSAKSRATQASKYKHDLHLSVGQRLGGLLTSVILLIVKCKGVR